MRLRAKFFASVPHFQRPGPPKPENRWLQRIKRAKPQEQLENDFAVALLEITTNEAGFPVCFEGNLELTWLSP